ncbi:MAG: sensor histidine kinase, partial [Actinomycetota bacterium]|nr:sensor histidine kinase [Actinomycetota bacterium]
MRWRILQATLIAVAITGLVLGGPLVYASWRLVEHETRAELRTRLEQVVAQLDGQSSVVTDLRSVLPALPPRGQLVVDSPRTGRLVLGTDPGPGAVAESLPLSQGRTAQLAVPGGIQGDQLRAVALVSLLVGLSVGIGVAIATVTARRLAGPLQDLADRAAQLGTGDFHLAPARHGIPELDRVAELLDTSAAALAELVARERHLVGDVSHQLRSRLTALQLRLDELAAHPDPATAAEAEAALEQAERLGA